MKPFSGRSIDVDDYLAQLPELDRVALEKLRFTIQSAAPDSIECIASLIPTYKLNGVLVGFAAHKNHLGFYVMSPEVMKQFDDLLIAYETTTTVIRFTNSTPLPSNLVKKIVHARMNENDAIFRAKKKS